MTNGEKLKEIFPNIDIRLDAETGIIIVKWADNTSKFFKASWWNAKYEESTTKNDLGVDCISRAEAIKCLECDFDITGKENMKTVVNYINSAHDKIVNLPRVKQEPFKPMVEIDLDYVIKQKYIEREVLDKISAEIKDYFSITCDGNCDNCNRVVKNPCGESVDGAWVLHIIDKYKAENVRDKE